MLDGILLNPDNRFLSQSTQDFGLYGGQTPAELQFSRADVAEAAVETGPEPKSTPTPEISTDDAAEALAIPAAPTDFVETSVALSFGSAPIAPAAIPLTVTPLVPPDVNTVPVSTGSVFAPIVMPQSVPAQVPEAAPAESGAGSVTTIVPPVENVFADVGDTVAGVTNSVAQVAETVAEAAKPVTEIVDTLLVDPLDAATSGPLTDSTLSFTEDTLSDLTGSDPLGGVATLVSLVSVEDVFDVADTATDELVSAPVPDLLDTLAADLPVESPLLGETDHADDSPLGDLHDPLGLI